MLRMSCDKFEAMMRGLQLGFGLVWASRNKLSLNVKSRPKPCMAHLGNYMAHARCGPEKMSEFLKFPCTNVTEKLLNKAITEIMEPYFIFLLRWS